LPAVRTQDDGTAFIVGDRMNLAVAASARVSYAAIWAPFFRPLPAVRCTLMCVLSKARISGVAAITRLRFDKFVRQDVVTPFRSQPAKASSLSHNQLLAFV
jgi:hypothetical protein